MSAGEFHDYPPYYMALIIDGEQRVTAPKPEPMLCRAITLFTMAGRLKEPVTPRLKAYIKANTTKVEKSKHLKELGHGTETV